MLLDTSVLQQSCGGDDEFARELFGEYHTRVLELLPLMQEKLSQGKLDELRKVAHEMKGSSLTLGASEIARLSRSIEEACSSGKADPLAGYIAELNQQAEALFEHLRGLSYL